MVVGIAIILGSDLGEVRHGREDLLRVGCTVNSFFSRKVSVEDDRGVLFVVKVEVTTGDGSSCVGAGRHKRRSRSAPSGKRKVLVVVELFIVEIHHSEEAIIVLNCSVQGAARNDLSVFHYRITWKKVFLNHGHVAPSSTIRKKSKGNPVALIVFIEDFFDDIGCAVRFLNAKDASLGEELVDDVHFLGKFFRVAASK